MTGKVFNVLFLCTGNSARSIMAECALNRWGQGRFCAFSAGSHPKGRVHPVALQVLQNLNFQTGGLRSKDWAEFARPGAPPLDFVFTLCDSAASEPCPAWPGQPMTAHWGVEDPAAFEGPPDKAYKEFRKIYGFIDNRIKIFVSLPIASLDRMSLQKRLEEIGRATQTEPATADGRSAATAITIYHNPDCETSRNVLGLIRNSGVEPKVVQYLKTPPSRRELVDLIARMGITVRDLLRRKGTPYDELGLDNPKWSDPELIDQMLTHPILINRPIVVTPLGVKLCRPSEVVLDILSDPQRGSFTKEDGELVIDSDGRRVA